MCSQFILDLVYSVMYLKKPVTGCFEKLLKPLHLNRWFNLFRFNIKNEVNLFEALSAVRTKTPFKQSRVLTLFRISDSLNRKWNFLFLKRRSHN